ncbi:MAG: leucine-rich repeat domain-containing protein [Rhodothermaceae bacterium]|nr:leucine-rich repeat domain-containing protein [Rhodothermaceae bacterium]
MNFSALFEKTPLITNECIWIATPRPFWKCGLAFCCPFVSTRSQKTSEEFLVLSPSSRILEGVFSWRLSHVSSLVTFLSLLLSGLVLAQVSEHASSMETEFKKEQGWEENIISTTATPYRDDRIRRERFRLKSEAYGLVHDRLRREMPVAGNSAEKPVAHMSMNICDRTAVVMDAIISRISATNDCSEVTSTQLAAITGTLNLSSKNISSLQAGFFDVLISLNTLYLSRKDLTALPAGIFDELTSLTRLDLGRNDLSTLPAGIFDKLTSLNTLNLGHNGLSTLPAGIFDELTVLDWVDLRANDLSTLSDGIFDELSSLTGLGLSGNDLSTLSNGIFDELTSLTELGLAGNDFSTLSADIFDELISLTSLHLGDNSLSSLPDGIFDELTSLTWLWLWGNDFSTLPEGIFDGLT